MSVNIIDNAAVPGLVWGVCTTYTVQCDVRPSLGTTYTMLGVGETLFQNIF